MSNETASTTPQTTNERFPILDFFKYAHLPPHLQEVSRDFHEIAWKHAAKTSAHPAEVAAGLRKLLEAKDCLVRAALPVAKANPQEL